MPRKLRFEGEGDYYLATLIHTVSNVLGASPVYTAFLVPRDKIIVVTDGDFERLTYSGHIGAHGLRDLGQI
jgi:hypothetical protein